MLKNNNASFVNPEEAKNVICISDYYPNNCSEQEYVEVSQKILDTYAEFDEIDKKQYNWDRNHKKKIAFDEQYIGECLGICIESPEDTFIGKESVESLVSLCGEIVFRRSIKYYLYKKTLKDIAQEENVSINAIRKSVKAFERILKKMHRIKF